MFNPETTTLVSGGSSHEVDVICERVAGVLGWTIERHPSNQDKFGDRADFVKNYNMVHSEIDICLVFIKNRCVGATMVAELAKENDILTYILNHPKGEFR